MRKIVVEIVIEDDEDFKDIQLQIPNPKRLDEDFSEWNVQGTMKSRAKGVIFE